MGEAVAVALAMAVFAAARPAVRLARKRARLVALRKLYEQETSMAFPRRSEKEPPRFIDVTLTEYQAEKVCEAVMAYTALALAIRKEIVKQIELGKPSLPPASLDFDRLKQEAARRHCSEADVIFDLARAKDAA